MIEPFVDAGWLQRNRADVVLADVRWYLDGRSGRAAYEQGHIPGAVFVDLDTVLSEPHEDDSAGRHPLPTPARFAAGLGALGIGDADTVVAYDDSGGIIAARLVWLLRVTGHDAALLDGGLQAWPAADLHPDHPRPGVVSRKFASRFREWLGARGDARFARQILVVSAANRVVPRASRRREAAVEFSTHDTRPPATFTPVPWPQDRLVQIDEVASSTDVLIDARDAGRFNGGPDAVDPRSGHIPGARSVSTRDHLDGDLRIGTPETLRASFAAAGISEETPVISYCGSGVSACHNLLALERAGLGPGRLYPGSWSEWSRDPARPIEPS